MILEDRIDYLVQSKLSEIYYFQGKALEKWITNREFSTKEEAMKYFKHLMAQYPKWTNRIVRRRFTLELEDTNHDTKTNPP